MGHTKHPHLWILMTMLFVKYTFNDNSLYCTQSLSQIRLDVAGFYVNPKFGNNFGDFVQHRKDVTKMTLHTWRRVSAGNIIL